MDASEEFSFGADYFDSRDVIGRIDYLESEAEDRELDEYEQSELNDLKAFADEAEVTAPDWEYGAQFVADESFTDYAKELAEDIGAIDRNAEWPLYHIDWEAAADDLKQDYTEVTLRGTDYWTHS
jgi:antirestriction protein